MYNVHCTQRFCEAKIYHSLCMLLNLVISPAAASSSIEITEIDLGSALFAYNNVFISLLNYMQYKLTFTY